MNVILFMNAFSKAWCSRVVAGERINEVTVARTQKCSMYTLLLNKYCLLGKQKERFKHQHFTGPQKVTTNDLPTTYRGMQMQIQVIKLDDSFMFSNSLL